MLLFRFLRLWYCLLFQTTTLKPTPYVYIHEKHVQKYTLWASSVAMFWNI